MRRGGGWLGNSGFNFLDEQLGIGERLPVAWLGA
jgi:hypothetical protein